MRLVPLSPVPLTTHTSPPDATCPDPATRRTATGTASRRRVARRARAAGTGARGERRRGGPGGVRSGAGGPPSPAIPRPPGLGPCTAVTGGCDARHAAGRAARDGVARTIGWGRGQVRLTCFHSLLPHASQTHRRTDAQTYSIVSQKHAHPQLYVQPARLTDAHRFLISRLAHLAACPRTLFPELKQLNHPAAEAQQVSPAAEVRSKFLLTLAARESKKQAHSVGKAAHPMLRDVSDVTAVRAVPTAVAAAASSWLVLQGARIQHSGQ